MNEKQRNVVYDRFNFASKKIVDVMLTDAGRLLLQHQHLMFSFSLLLGAIVLYGVSTWMLVEMTRMPRLPS